MRAVVYDAYDMEPITVIEVPQHFIREMERGKRDRELCFAVMPELKAGDFDAARPVSAAVLSYYVRLHFEPIFKGDRRIMWLCTTRDGETALKLRSVFLAGQRPAVRDAEERAFLKGMFAAMGV